MRNCNCFRISYCVIAIHSLLYIYKTLALESKEIENFKFVWITDGVGWNTAKNNLEETFDVLDTLYNINDLENDAFKELFEK